MDSCVAHRSSERSGRYMIGNVCVLMIYFSYGSAFTLWVSLNNKWTVSGKELILSTDLMADNLRPRSQDGG